MSTIAKIFTVLNLILAAAFLGWAASALKSNQEWREKYERRDVDAIAEKTKLDTDNRALGAKVTDLEKRNQALISERDELKNAKDRLETEVAGERTKTTQQQASLDQIAATLQGIEDTKGQLQTDKDRAEKAMRDAEAARAAAIEAQSAAEKLANELQAQLETANLSIADLEKARTTLQKDRTSLETQIETLVANTGARVEDFAPVPDISGGVLGVSMAVEPGLVSINAGSNKGVKRGYTFEIYDGKTYKGQARVEFVHPEMSSAVITIKVPGQTIRQGDSASTRL